MFSRIRHRIAARLALKRGVVPWLGGCLHFPKDSLIGRSIVYTGAWEPEIVAYLVEAAKPKTVVFDVGANIGASAIEVLHNVPEVTVVSFEPSPSVLPFLESNRRLSRYKESWVIITKAATSVAGQTVEFSQFSQGGDVFEGIRDTGRGGASKKIEVLTTTVDAEWEALGRPDVSLIKIDVEGAELSVLMGAEDCIKANSPVIITEWCKKNFVAYNNKPGDMLGFARNINYDVYVLPELTPVSCPKLFSLQLARHENILLFPSE